MEQEKKEKHVERVKMQGEKVPKKLETTVEYQMFDAVDLSTDIPWTIIEVDNEEESNDLKQEAEPMVEIPKVFLFCERMKRLSPHRLPLKERMKDRTISYVDLLCLNPLPVRLKQDPMPRVSRWLGLRKVKSKDERATSDE